MALIFLGFLAAGSSLLPVLLIVAGLFWLSNGVVAARPSRPRRSVIAGTRALRDDVANQILDLEDRVLFAPSDDALTLFRQATARYAAVAETVDLTVRPRQASESHRQLRRARWELEQSQAVIEGRPPSRETRARRRRDPQRLLLEARFRLARQTCSW